MVKLPWRAGQDAQGDARITTTGGGGDEAGEEGCHSSVHQQQMCMIPVTGLETPHCPLLYFSVCGLVHGLSGFVNKGT